MEAGDEQAREAAVGQMLKAARGSLSQRAAARRAGISPTQWRHMEQGSREHGVPVRAKDATLASAALAVGLDVADVFRVAGREVTPDIERMAADADRDDDRLSVLERDVAEVKSALAEVVRRLDAAAPPPAPSAPPPRAPGARSDPQHP